MKSVVGEWILAAVYAVLLGFLVAVVIWMWIDYPEEAPMLTFICVMLIIPTLFMGFLQLMSALDKTKERR
jgi:uncharacterized membrane protein